MCRYLAVAPFRPRSPTPPRTGSNGEPRASRPRRDLLDQRLRLALPCRRPCFLLSRAHQPRTVQDKPCPAESGGQDAAGTATLRPRVARMPRVSALPPNRPQCQSFGLVVISAGNWAGSGRHGPSPSCFGPKGVGPRRPKKISGRAVPAQRVKIEAQPGPKARRAFFGPCRPKHGPHITKINNKTYEDTQISTIRNSHNSKYLNMKHT